MTVWDVLYKYIDKGLSWTLLIAAIVLIVWLLSHPQTVRERPRVEYSDNCVDCSVRTQEKKKSIRKAPVYDNRCCKT